MAALGSQTIASSYEQLLHTDTDGGGNGNTLVTIKDGDNGTTFGIKLATNKVEIIPGSNDANAFEVSQADGTAILTINSSTPSVLVSGSGTKLYFSDAGGEYISGNGSILSIVGGNEIDLTATDIDINGAANISGALVIGGDVSMTQAGQAILHVNSTGDAAQLKLSALSGGSNYEWSIYSNNAADQFLIVDGSATRLVIDASGNVGIGTTNPEHLLHVEGDNKAIEVHSADYSNIRLGAAGSSGGDLDKGVILIRENGSNKSQITGTGVTYFGGNVGIGTAVPGVPFEIMKAVAGGALEMVMDNSDATTSLTETVGFRFRHNGGTGFRVLMGKDDDFQDNAGKSGHLKFMATLADTETEAMRITSAGNVGIGTTSPSHKLQVESNANTFAQKIQNTHGTTPYGLVIDHDADVDNNTHKFLNCEGNGNNRCIIWSDGDVNNDDNGYGSISDQRIKQSIRDANSQWDDIKAIKVRNFKKNSDVIQYKDKAWEQIGVIAQELESSGMDKLVREHPANEFDIANNEDINEGDMVKSVQYSIIYMKAIKALQEAMTKIETLEAKVEALENA